MHCLIKFSGISSKLDENLPFKLCHFKSSFSVTGKMNMVLGQHLIFCGDNWQLKWLLFWFENSYAIHSGGVRTSVTFWRFVIFSLPVRNFLSILRGFPKFFVYYMPHFLFYCLHLKYTCHFLYFFIPLLLFYILFDIW
jgi:hypothetical protein